MKVFGYNKKIPAKPAEILLLIPVNKMTTLTKADTWQFELYSNPGIAGAATYKVTVYILKGRELLQEVIH